ncbi:hypothetical protein SSU05_1772 [Streptococcus suis 05ZYH33]|nr:hypothetical protein SSU05_1772 [Streptococcus suis 05ZYH33]
MKLKKLFSLATGGLSVGVLAASGKFFSSLELFATNV